MKPKELEWLLLKKDFIDWSKLSDSEMWPTLLDALEWFENNKEDYIQSLLTQQRTELLEEILEENHCDLDGTYDYDGIAESVIKLAKKL